MGIRRPHRRKCDGAYPRINAGLLYTQQQSSYNGLCSSVLNQNKRQKTLSSLPERRIRIQQGKAGIRKDAQRPNGWIRFFENLLY